MMKTKEIITKRKIEALASEYEITDPVLKAIYSQNKNDREPKVFISHSILDIDFVKKVLLFLYYSKGVSGYVDWQDPDMPIETSAETARKIKKRIDKAKKMIYVVTYESLKSVWCSWEVGYADKAKGQDNIAILSIKPNNGRWKRNEFIEQYPSISYDDKKKLFYVKKLDGHKVTLYDWLQ